MSNRELDAEVAEKVMDWQTFKGIPEFWQCRIDDQTLPSTKEMFKPTECEESAFRVVAQLLSSGYRFACCTVPDGWSVLLTPPKGKAPVVAVEKTLPLSICRAALAAISS